MASPTTDEIVALEDALQKRDKLINAQRDLIERTRAIIVEAIDAQSWHGKQLGESFYRQTLAEIDDLLAETVASTTLPRDH